MAHYPGKKMEARQHNNNKNDLNVPDANKIIEAFSMTAKTLVIAKEFGLPGRARSKSLESSVEEQRKQTKSREITRDKAELRQEHDKDKSLLEGVFSLAAGIMKENAPMVELDAKKLYKKIEHKPEKLKTPKTTVLNYILGCCDKKLNTMGFGPDTEQQKRLNQTYEKACKIFEEIESKKKSRSAAWQRFRA